MLIRKIKYSYNFFTLKPEERYLCRNAQIFKGFDMVATTSSRALWQESRTSIKKLTSIQLFRLLWIKQSATGWFHILLRSHSTKSSVWFATMLVLSSLPMSSMTSIQTNFTMKYKFSLIDISSNMTQHTRSPSNIVCRICLSVISTWALITVLKQCWEWSGRYRK